MDVVYVLKPGDHNEELRHSLRSLGNLPHARVWLAGSRPSWTRSVGHISVTKRATKYLSTTANMRAACEHPEVSDPFIYFNDDFFVIRPLRKPPTLHRGPASGLIAYYEDRYGPQGGPYLAGARESLALLRQLGIAEPLSYEVHAPLVVHKAAMVAALDTGRHLEVLHKRTLYGNLQRIGGQRVEDCKILDARSLPGDDWPYVSTSDGSFKSGAVGEWLRERFPSPSPYERL